MSSATKHNLVLLFYQPIIETILQRYAVKIYYDEERNWRPPDFVKMLLSFFPSIFLKYKCCRWNMMSIKVYFPFLSHHKCWMSQWVAVMVKGSKEKKRTLLVRFKRTCFSHACLSARKIFLKPTFLHWLEKLFSLS